MRTRFILFLSCSLLLPALGGCSAAEPDARATPPGSGSDRTAAGSTGTGGDHGAGEAGGQVTPGGAGSSAKGGHNGTGGESAGIGGATGPKGWAGGGSGAGRGGSVGKGGATGGGASSGSGGSTGTGGAAATGKGGTTQTGGSGGSGNSCTPSTEKFSFFVASQARMFKLAQDFNGSTKGFGGDLRYGETGQGAGLKGADKICTAIAEASMPGNCKVWKAFLSTSTENAIDRIGKGPWYDRYGNLFGNSPTEVTAARPPKAAASIQNDLPNEDGIPNHDALQKGSTTNQDNHDILTGSDTSGKLYQGSTSTNCQDWTSTDKSIRPRVGHSWPAAQGTIGGGGTGFPGGGMFDSGSGMGDLTNWMSCLDENGCAPGLNLNDMSIPDGRDGTVGGGGGYGAIYCFALTP